MVLLMSAPPGLGGGAPASDDPPTTATDPARSDRAVRATSGATLLGEVLATLAPEVHAALPDAARDPTRSPFESLIPRSYIDPDRPHHTRYVPVGAPETLPNEDHPNPIRIDEDWVVNGTLILRGADVRFSGPHFIKVQPGGTLVVDGGTNVTYPDADPLAPGAIIVLGDATVEGTSQTPIRFANVTLASYRPRGGPDGSTRVDHAAFVDGPLGIAAGHSGVRVEHASFANLATGVAVLNVETEGDPPVLNRPQFSNLTFVGNYVGYFVLAGAPRSPNGVPTLGGIGHLTHSEFRGNAFGVQCHSHGYDAGPNDLNPVKPLIEHSNFDHDMGEGYTGLKGGHIDAPPLGTSSSDIDISDSRCVVKTPHWGNDTHYTGGSDTVEDEVARHADLSNPPSPIDLEVVDGDETWAEDRDLDHPVVVAPGANLTLRGMTLRAHGYLLGSSRGNEEDQPLQPPAPRGELYLEDVVVEDPAIVLRTDDGHDGVHGLELTGTARFAGALSQWRNHKTLDDFHVRDLVGLAWFASGALLLDANETEWRAHATGCSAVNTTMFTGEFNIGDGRLSDCTFDDLNVVVVSIAGTLTLRDNNATRVLAGAVSVLSSTLDATGDRWESGGIAYASAVATSVSLTDEVIASSLIGYVSGLDLGIPTLADANVTFNALGVVAVADTVKVGDALLEDHGTNILHNYLLGYLTLDLENDLNGQPVNVPGKLDCTAGCHSPDDEAASATFLGDPDTDLARGLDSPSWAGRETLVDGTAANASRRRLDLGSGPLAGPILARKGGRIVAEGADVDGRGRYPLGTKSGGDGEFDAGRLDVSHSRLRDLAFVALNSTEARLRQSQLEGRGGIVAMDRAPEIECTSFRQSYAPLTFFRSRPGEQLEFRHNRIGNATPPPTDKLQLDTLPLHTGVVFGLAGSEGNDARLEENAVDGGAALLVRRGDGDVEAHDNNLDRRAWAAERSLVKHQTALNLTGNWWGDASGPTIDSFNRSLNPNGTGARVVYDSWDDENVTPPTLEGPADGFRATSVAIPPCAAFRYDPPAPREQDAVTFTDLSFSLTPEPVARWAWDFGDGNTSDQQHPTHAFGAGRDYQVTLAVTVDRADGAALNATVRRLLTVANRAPVADFDWTPAHPTDADPVQFHDESHDPSPTGSVQNWTWDLGDGNTSHAQHPAHAYRNDGDYTVRLTVRDNQGATNSTSRLVAVANAPPRAAFDFDPSEPTDADPVRFTDRSTDPSPTGRVLNWTWDFGDGNRSFAANTSHAFREPGDHTVTLTVRDDEGATNSTDRTVPVGNAPPLANFTFTPLDPTDGVDVQFNDTSSDPSPTGRVENWTWDFGHDGAVSYVANPTHRFPDNGTYLVRLTVRDDDGATGEARQSVAVANEPPHAAFSFDPAAPRPGDEVVFNASGSSDANGGDLTYAWDFGDNTTGSGLAPTHAYAAPGQYVVALTATDEDGATAHATRTVPVNDAPTAAFAFAPAVPHVGQAVTFTDESMDADGAIRNWTWDFGDDSPLAHTQNATHAYATPGDHAARLTVRDDDGASSTTERTVPVNARPVANFSHAPADPTPGQAIQFTDQSTDADGSVVNWTWDFGDDSAAAHTPNATHAYAEPGDYDVNLTVRDDDGATASKVRRIVMTNDPPVADFAAALGAKAVAFDGTLSTDPDQQPLSYAWRFGDGSTSTDAAPTHTYTRAGEYDVTLTVSDGRLNDTVTKRIVATCTVAPNEAEGFEDEAFDTGCWYHANDGGETVQQQVTTEWTVRSHLADDDCLAHAGDKSAAMSTCPDAGGWGYGDHEDDKLVSPFFDLDGASKADLKFWHWEGLDACANPPSDEDSQVRVQVRSAPDASWNQLDSLCGFEDEWQDESYALGAPYLGSGLVQFRFRFTNTITNGEGFFLDEVQVKTPEPPVADFAWSPDTPFVDETVAFTDESEDPDDDLDSWSWEFGDGATSAARNPSHTYAAAGDYVVRLTVTDDEGLSDVVTKTVHAVPGPHADFSFAPAQPHPNETVQFTDQSTDPDHNVASWRWEFGDNTNSTARNPSHAYARCGDYTVRLTVTDADGFSDDVTKTVRVRHEAVPNVRTCVLGAA